jgi:putative transcriptional regulator
MHEEDSGQITLEGSLILAAPNLQEPTFRHSVLLLTEHGPEHGALGYILNRPLGKSVGDLLPDAEFKELADIPVYIGGPVSTEHLTFSSLGWSEEEEKLQYTTHLSARQAIRHIKEGFSIRAFVGYSGWAKGQLENELLQKAWITHKPEKQVVETEDLGTLWNRMLREISPWHSIMANEPDDPWLN